MSWWSYMLSLFLSSHNSISPVLSPSLISLSFPFSFSVFVHALIFPLREARVCAINKSLQVAGMVILEYLSTSFLRPAWFCWWHFSRAVVHWDRPKAERLSAFFVLSVFSCLPFLFPALVKEEIQCCHFSSFPPLPLDCFPIPFLEHKERCLICFASRHRLNHPVLACLQPPFASSSFPFFFFTFLLYSSSTEPSDLLQSWSHRIESSRVWGGFFLCARWPMTWMNLLWILLPLLSDFCHWPLRWSLLTNGLTDTLWSPFWRIAVWKANHEEQFTRLNKTACPLPPSLFSAIIFCYLAILKFSCEIWSSELWGVCSILFIAVLPCSCLWPSLPPLPLFLLFFLLSECL